MNYAEYAAACNVVRASQVDKMLHAIGYSSARATGRKYRKYEPFRNYYTTAPGNDEGWGELCELGLAERYVDNVFIVTKTGFEFLSRFLDISIAKEYGRLY